MNLRSLRSFLLVAVGALLVATPFAHAKKGTPDEQRAEIRKERDQVLAELYKLNPAAKDQVKKAAGYAVFTNVGVNLFVASTGHGHGIVIKKGTFKDTETFMSMFSVGFGIGLGIKDFRAVFVFDDAEKLKTFVESGWDFSGQADAAAKSNDKGAAAAVAETAIPGVHVYQITKNGLALQATLQGTKYWKNKDLN